MTIVQKIENLRKDIMALETELTKKRGELEIALKDHMEGDGKSNPEEQMSEQLLSKYRTEKLA